ncbi:hypothetical protein H4696_002841 [Amycolatopsis lexingtonensis]|uniref:Uncharacterized protein n=1 Tax=Amycolatopsis lexingtonensis TaxID=218822 RepID=A0ABR9HXT6_9PSEU|nr:hypothetical protein [Amycolatopsis lexingtonensis]MBE1495741.1 hypothetical protein [Amycolatopsis lexingtonensis]
MDVPEVLLCERCWRPIHPDEDHVVRQIRDEAHPLPVVLFSCFHLDGDPACHVPPPSRVTVVHEHEVFPVVVDPPPEDEHRRE